MLVQQTLAVSRGMEFFSEYGNWNTLEVHKECATEHEFLGFFAVVRRYCVDMLQE